jgi:cobalt-zinc-cadmium efflux system membrane fusion protein
MKTQPKLIIFFVLFLPIFQASAVLAHGGHGDEFSGEHSATTLTTGIEVDEATQKRLGIITQPISKQLLNFGVKTTGQIETQPNKQVEITAPIAGTVTELLVQPGDTVDKGQVVAVIASPELLELRTESLDRSTEAEANLREAEANLNEAKANYANEQKIAQQEIEAAKIDVSIAQENYDRDHKLVKEGALPRRSMLDSQNRLLEAKIVLARAIASREVLEAKTAVERSTVEVDAAKSNLGLAANNYQSRLQQLNTTANDQGLVTVLAPIAGSVASLELTLGESIEDRGTKLMTVVDSQEVLATANIPERDLSRVKIGQQVRVRVAGMPNKTFVSRIAQIDPTVRDTRVVAVRAKLNNASQDLKPGMFAELEVLTDQTAEAVLTIPTSAVIEANGKQLVYIQNGNNSYQAVDVTLGQTHGNVVAIQGSLFEGDRLVIEGATMLYAESLRGGTPKKEAAVTPESLEGSEANSLSLWLMTIGSGAIATATFFLGRFTNPQAQSSDSELVFEPISDNNSAISQEEQSIDLKN